jgi:hypothetical protein
MKAALLGLTRRHSKTHQAETLQLPTPPASPPQSATPTLQDDRANTLVAPQSPQPERSVRAPAPTVVASDPQPTILPESITIALGLRLLQHATLGPRHLVGHSK